MLLASCHSPPGIELVQRSQPLLGTFVTISVYSADREKANAAIAKAFAEFHRVDRLISIHHAESELSRLNSRAATDPVTVSPELFDLIAQAVDIARKTEGSFDPTIRPLADLWGFIWKEYRMPTPAELRAVLPKVNYELVELNRANLTVRFRGAGMSLDFGGIGKGYAVDRAIAQLRSLGIVDAMVRAGGDIRVIGVQPGKSHWVVQIEDPTKAGNRQRVSLRDAAISTSGNYENFFMVKGKRYSHILNPRTGLPAEGTASCSVIAPTCTESDALSTAFFVYGWEKTMKKFGGDYGIQFITIGPGESLQQVANADFLDAVLP